MTDRLFEGVESRGIECVNTFISENLSRVAESNVSAYDLVEKIGSFAVFPLCEDTQAAAVARIHNIQIWGDELRVRE